MGYDRAHHVTPHRATAMARWHSCLTTWRPTTAIIVAMLVGLLCPQHALATHNLSGRVVNSQGVGIEYVMVQPYEAGNDTAIVGQYGSTDQNGLFSFGLNPPDHAIHLWFGDFPAVQTEYRGEFLSDPPHAATIDQAWRSVLQHSWGGLVDEDWFLVRDIVLIDVVPPKTVDVREYVGPAANAVLPSNWVKRDLRLVFRSTDYGVGVAQNLYQLAPSSGAWGPDVYSTGADTVGEGSWKVRFRSVDWDGNTSGYSSPVSLYIDRTPPVSRPVGPTSEWVRGVELTATDSVSGPKSFYYSVDGGQTYGLSGNYLLIGPSGPHTVNYWSSDWAGNVEAAKTMNLKVDITPPKTTFAPLSKYVAGGTITLSATDDHSGVSAVHWYFDTMPVQTGAVAAIPTTPGPHTLHYYSVDKVGNTDNTYLSKVDLVVEAAPTHTLTYIAGAHGSIEGSTTQVVAHNGSGTAVIAIPERGPQGTGYHFAGWSDGVITSERTDSGVITNLTVEAKFAINTYTLRYTAGADGSVVGSATQVVDCYASGTAVTAVPAPRHHFVQWSDGVMTATRTDTLVMADCNVLASFADDATYKTVYRFRNLRNGFYLWTADENEKNNIVANAPRHLAPRGSGLQDQHRQPGQLLTALALRQHPGRLLSLHRQPRREGIHHRQPRLDLALRGARLQRVHEHLGLTCLEVPQQAERRPTSTRLTRTRRTASSPSSRPPGSLKDRRTTSRRSL